MKVLTDDIITAVGKQIEPNRNTMSGSELDAFNAILSNISRSNERVLKIAELRKVIESEPDADRRAELQDQLIAIIKE